MPAAVQQAVLASPKSAFPHVAPAQMPASSLMAGPVHVLAPAAALHAWFVAASHIIM